MLEKMQSTLVKSISSHIHQSQREVTILFTDIENSTQFWSNRGNVKGRLMVDRHNRILFPIVRQFRGKVIKTIGDSVMAMFFSPEDALSAATAIQQAMQRARDDDQEFCIHLRIGLHIGEAIVEHNDVYGDVVNVASRIESEAERDEILVSGRLARRLDKERFKRNKKGGFTPKGKRERIGLYLCHWQEHEDLLKNLKLKAFIPLGTRQSMEMLAYAMALAAVLYFFHLTYTRYLLADNEALALLFLNPTTMLLQYWYLSLPLALLTAFTLWRAMRINAIPYRVFKVLKGASAGGIAFVLLYSLTQQLPMQHVLNFDSGIYYSHHLFVEVLVDNALLREAPEEESETLMYANTGTLLLLSDVREVDDKTWNKVLIGEKQFGWIERIRPESMGVPKTRITWAEKFKLRYGDFYLLLLALPAAIWGFRSFRVRPI